MRIVFVNRYFWPETVLVNEISRWAANAGHKVTVLTGQPDYNPEADHPSRVKSQVWDGVRIQCVMPLHAKGRGVVRNIINLLFVFAAFFKILLGPPCDVVWTTSIPPIIQPLLLRLATRVRGAKLIYYPQDIYPEIALVSGIMNPGFASRLLRKLDGWVLEKADRVITISEDMKQILIERGANPSRTSVIRSFSPYSPSSKPCVEPGIRPLRFLFSGNLGRFQNLDLIIDAFAGISPNLAELHFLGEGREKARLQKKVAEQNIKNVFFLPGTDPMTAQDISRSYHAGIVSLSPEIFNYAYPAKTYTYLAAGLPLFAVIEDKSELVNVITTHKIGQTVDVFATVSEISAAIQSFEGNHAVYGKNVMKHTHLHDPKTARDMWQDMFSDLQRKTT